MDSQAQDLPLSPVQPSQAAAQQTSGLLFAAVAGLIFASGPVLTRLAAPLSAFEITFWRMLIATFTVSVFALVSQRKWPFPRDDIPRFFLYGLVTAAHFLFFIASLQFTTIAHSICIVYTAPIFVSIFSWVFLKEGLRLRQGVGVAIAVAGLAYLTSFEPNMTPRMLVGDLLALGSAITFGLYSVAGRRERNNYPLLSYALGLYGTATLWLAPAAIWQFTGAYTIGNVSALASLGILPLGTGHTLYNAALRRIKATYVNILATQEVFGGIVLGWLILGDVPSANALTGVAITLVGVTLVLF